MSGKLYIASALTFMLIGCGGSNSGTCCIGGIDKDEIAKGSAFVVAKDGQTNKTIEAKKDNKGNATSYATINNVTGNGVAVCPESNPCKFEVTQNASKCDSEDDVQEPMLQITDCEKDSAKSFLTNKFNPDTEIVVFGGILVVEETTGQVTECGLNIDIKIPSYWCGKEIGSGRSTGFTGEYKNDDSVYVLITVAGDDGCSTTIWKKAKIRDGKIILENLDGVTLPAKFSLFRITAKPGYLSGVTGVFSGAE